MRIFQPVDHLLGDEHRALFGQAEALRIEHRILPVISPLKHTIESETGLMRLT